MQDFIYLAPMRGFTDAIYRNTFNENFSGLDAMVAPFISSVKGPRVNPKLLKDVLPEYNSCIPLIPQIIGKSAHEFIVLAQALLDIGYETVNWNLGCPYPMVAKKGRGSGMLPYPDRIDAFLESVFNSSSSRLSVKVRLGRFHQQELFDLMPVFNRYPLTEIIIHPRTGVQMYDGKVDLAAFEGCASISRHPVVYNGDIVSRNSFLTLKERLPYVSRWMIGRGLLANPFLAELIKANHVEVKEQQKRFKTFHDILLTRYGEKLHGDSHLLQRMKGLWRYLAVHLIGGEQLLKKIRKAKKLSRYRNIVDDYFDGGGGLKGINV